MGWSTPSATRAPARSRSRAACSSSKRRKCTESFLVVLALEILVGDGPDARRALDFDPDLALDALQLGEPAPSLLRVQVLEQHGGLPVAAVGDERVVGVELVLDAVLLKMRSMRSISCTW